MRTLFAITSESVDIALFLRLVLFEDGEVKCLDGNGGTPSLPWPKQPVMPSAACHLCYCLEAWAGIRSMVTAVQESRVADP